MNITFEELRRIKHALPHGSIAKIAQDLAIDEQTVRSYFGSERYHKGGLAKWHLEQGPDGGVIHFEDETILQKALQILEERKTMN